MSYEREAAFAKELAHEAGKIMRRYFRADDVGTKWKNDGTPLTIADTAVNDLVIKLVKAEFPEYGVIGEESSYDANGNLVWVLDPIDGTIPFSIGIPVSTFSLGLVDRADGQTVAAVVYDPQLDELYTSVRGEGAFLNGKKLAVSGRTDLKNTYVSVIAGTLAQQEGSAFAAGRCADLMKEEGAKPLSLFSQVYSAAKVATGELVGSVFGYGSPWDSAAVSLIVEEAGGIVTDTYGDKRRFDEWGKGCVLAANQEILRKMLELIKASR